jgi:hypothetical protein
MAILGPKNDRFGLRDPDFVQKIIFLTFKNIYEQFKCALIFTMIPMWGSICLGQVVLAYT